jgi:hypothetical protein
MNKATYDRIGRGYALTRRADPRIAARISAALRPARSIVNVGAGAGSYEPEDVEVIAVEPSRETIARRAPNAGRAIVAGELLPPRPRAAQA